ncbi:hypothetical protein [Paracoccus sp. (in: a-proteobacteria)]|uniref:hypothetical protein n=1 Tax=Paracoccus sp. TaxID=267 RepID=UPI0028AC3B01|nr:hypothetical protein [Paracoccus sp. (in: a-proteobacteria)]
MPRLIRSLVLTFLLLADSALAGPWPREMKGMFLALSTERDAQGNSYTALYGEYGLRPRLTLGMELGRSGADETSAMFWLQRALDRDKGPDRWALSFGAGVVERGGADMPVGQMAVSWGRGLETVPLLDRIAGGGWLSAEIRVKAVAKLKDEAEIERLAADGVGILAYITPETSIKAEATLGWHATSSWTFINQLRLEDREDWGFSASLASSAVRDIFGPAKLELGLIAPLSGEGELALKIGCWLEL